MMCVLSEAHCLWQVESRWGAIALASMCTLHSSLRWEAAVHGIHAHTMFACTDYALTSFSLNVGSRAVAMRWQWKPHFAWSVAALRSVDNATRSFVVLRDYGPRVDVS